MRVGALYDIHGDLPALDAGLSAAESARAESIVIGGDIVLGGTSREVLERVMALGSKARCIRGNCDRLVVDAFDGRPLPSRLPAAVHESIAATARELDRRHRDFLASLPETLVLGTVLFCHGSPRSDDEAIYADTPVEAVRPMLAGVKQSIVVCGHTHTTFERTIDAIRIINPGVATLLVLDV